MYLIHNVGSNNTHKSHLTCIERKYIKLQYLDSVFRWIKFEEDVEEGGNRWSKPHVATLSLHSLFELRSMLLNGTICLDMAASNLDDICELVCT